MFILESVNEVEEGEQSALHDFVFLKHLHQGDESHNIYFSEKFLVNVTETVHELLEI
jgi:hypothetical protein